MKLRAPGGMRRTGSFRMSPPGALHCDTCSRREPDRSSGHPPGTAGVPLRSVAQAGSRVTTRMEFGAQGALTVCLAPATVTLPSERPPKALRHLKETFRHLQFVRNSPLEHPAPTPAVVVCARSLLENGRVRAKSQCGQFTRTSVRLGCTSISSKAGLVGSRDFGPW